MTPNEPHGTLVHPVTIDIYSLDILTSLKKLGLIRFPGGARGVQLSTRLVGEGIHKQC